MRILAALMLSMTLLTTALLTRAVVTDHQRPAIHPASLADRVRDDRGRQPVVFRGP